MGFRDLSRFPTLKARYDKYEEWLKATPEQRQAKYAAITDEARRVKLPRVKGYISLFNTVGNNRIFVPVKIIPSTVTTGQGADVAGVLRGLLNTYTLTQQELGALTNPIVIEVAGGIKPAKLALTSVGASTKKASRITGAQYNKPDVDTVSSPFGQGTGGQDFDEAVAAIKGDQAYANFTTGDNAKNRAKFTPEGI